MVPSARTLLLFLITFFLLLFSSRSSLAASSSYTQPSYTAPTTDPSVPQNLHTYTQNLMIEIISAFSCQLTGIDATIQHQKCLGVSANGTIGFVENGGGALGVLSYMVGSLYNPPLHTGDYFAYLGRNFGLAKPAYATTGYESIKPLTAIWAAFRNIVYLIFVIVFAIVGLGIMLRLNIDPRTVMTIQNQIPKIIAGLLLTTFSLAIAGLLIDLMYVSIYVVFGVMSGIPNQEALLKPLSPAYMQGHTPIGAVGVFGTEGVSDMSFRVAGETRETVNSLLGIDPPSPKSFPLQVSGGSVSLVPFEVKAPNVTVGGGILQPNRGLANWIIDLISTAVGAGLGLQIGTATNTPLIGVPVGIIAGTLIFGLTEQILRVWGVHVLVWIILMISLIWALFRLWFALLTAYIFILLDIVLAPFWILAGLFPGSPIGFGPWMRDMLANLTAFPVAIALFLLGRVFMNLLGEHGSVDEFIPPLIGNPGNMQAIGDLIGIGIILMIPQALTMTRDLFKAPTFKYTAAIGQAVGVGAGAPGRLAGGTANTIFGTHYDKAGKLVQPAGTFGRFLRGFGFVR